MKYRNIVLFAALMGIAAATNARAADTSVTVVGLEAKGVDETVAELATDDFATAIEEVGIPIVSGDSLKAELKRRGFNQTCGVDDCPVAYEKIVKSTHLLRGSLFETKEKARILKVTVETVTPRKPIFSGRREFDASDASTTAATRDMARDIVECLQGKNCKDEPWGADGQMPAVAAYTGNNGIRGGTAPVDTTAYGVLRVNSRPQGADVYVDGDLKGKTPLTVPRVEAGDRTVIIHADGFADSTELVSIRPNQTADLSKALAELTGKLEIMTTPPDAQVFIDDKYVGQSPYKNSALRVGSYKIALKLKNYSDSGSSVTVEANRTARVDETLKGLPGKIVVTTTPPKATVYVDGNEAGKSLWSGAADPGTHKIRVALDGYQDGEKDVEVKPGQSAAASFTLEEAPKGYSGTASGGMVTIPAGNFLFGDDKQSVYLPAFKIDKTEVTVADYGKCVKAGKCQKPDSGQTYDNWEKPGRENHPVNEVNWNDAKAYCEWAGKRLPTEQEWEKAARGTDGRTYPWGEQAPTCERTIMDQGGKGCGKDSTWPVCSKTAGNSPYGLCDMAGNVWEWTADWYDSSNKWRVLRGGSWSGGNTRYFRAAYRYYFDPASRYDYYGFRCAQ